jgi:hypothetical protein
MHARYGHTMKQENKYLGVTSGKLYRLLMLVLAIQFLSACASSVSTGIFEQTPAKDYSNMYLRGVFNWWEVNEDFKLIEVAQDEYAVTIELIADNQPYDFKVADPVWSMSLNCGNEFEGVPMSLNEDIELVCASDSLNLQFTPTETAKYRFILDTSDNSQPELRIVKVG